MQDEPIVRHGYDRMTDPAGTYHPDKGRDIRGWRTGVQLSRIGTVKGSLRVQAVVQRRDGRDL